MTTTPTIQRKTVQKSTVALVNCSTYHYSEVRTAVQKGIDLLGGASLFARPSEKIVLKPNVVNGLSVDGCVNSHQTVFKATAEVFRTTGAQLLYGDSTGYLSCDYHMKKYGLKAIGDELGMTMAEFDTGKTVSNPTGLLSKKLTIANGVLNNDGVVSISKLKCHGLTVITGAVKNQFGCVPGAEKGQYHAKMPDVYDFSTMLVDVTAFVKPRLYIMDAIVAMEGNGPQSGDPRTLNVLLFSTDPVALDAIACKIINCNPAIVPTMEVAVRAGLGTMDYSAIECIGDPLEQFLCPTFKMVRKKPDRFTASNASLLTKKFLTPKPVIHAELCTRCGACVRQCPVNPKAVNWSDGDHKKPPHYSYDACIRCYCCHEFCPSKAITIKHPFICRLFPMLSFIGLFISGAFYRKKRHES